MKQNEAPIIVGLDIGTTKIVAIAARKNEKGKLEILGFGKTESDGVYHGLVQNIDKTVKSISRALENCLKYNPNLQIDEVYVGIAGKHIRSFQTPGEILRENADIEITKSEVDLLIENQHKTCIPAGDQIIDVIPQVFYIDKTQNIKEPIGCLGSKLGAKFHIITGDRVAIRNINRSVERSGLKIKDLILQPLASASAVMSDSDLEAGVAILDIGGGTSDLAVYCEGVLKHTEVIPWGGENITFDIQQGLGVTKPQAELLKIQFGSAIPDLIQANRFIALPGVRGIATREISVKNLSKIIQARMQEILEHVDLSLRNKGYTKNILNYGIILTGGGSQLSNLIQLTEYITSLDARIGRPNEYLAPNHLDELKNPMYATCIGLILQGYEDYEHNFLAPNKHYQNTDIPLHPIQQPDEKITQPMNENIIPPTIMPEGVIKKRKNLLRNFGITFKKTLLELFKEDEDKEIN